jgi:cellobiose transport system permease protein
MMTTTITRHREPVAPNRPPGRRPRTLLRRGWDRRPGPLTYLSLIALLFFSGFPLYYSVVVASHDNGVLGQVPPPLGLGGNLWANISRTFDTVPMMKALVNSVLVAGTITISVVLFSTLAGFAFAKLRFRGRNILLMFIIGTMMVPVQLGIIPLYMLMAKYMMVGKLPAVIAPMLVSAFGVFFMTQYLKEAVPDELLEAARADGCHTLRIFWHVVLPASQPAAAVLGTLTFLTAWNDFFWPLVVLTPDNPTVQVALSTLSSGYIADFSLVLAGATIATFPLLVVFALLGRRIIGGIMQGAVKG